MKTEEQKKKITLISTIAIGVTSIIASVATFCGIYFTTPDYRLVKNDYDFFVNVDKIAPNEMDNTYSLENDKTYFIELINGIRIDVDKIIENNPSFKSNNYKIDLAYYLNAVTIQNEKQPKFIMESRDKSIRKELPFVNDRKIMVEKIYVTDDTDYIDLIFEKSEENTSSIKNAGLQFFSLKGK